MGLAPPGCHEESVGKDPPYFSHSLIIEAEMVAYSEKLRQIDGKSVLCKCQYLTINRQSSGG